MRRSQTRGTASDQNEKEEGEENTVQHGVVVLQQAVQDGKGPDGHDGASDSLNTVTVPRNKETGDTTAHHNSKSKSESRTKLFDKVDILEHGFRDCALQQQGASLVKGAVASEDTISCSLDKARASKRLPHDGARRERSRETATGKNKCGEIKNRN